MATSNDHPGLPFLQAEGFTRGRPDGPPLWIVVHDMEASELPARAESTAVYFANPPDGRSVSSHFCADNDSVVQCVDEDDIAWTVGNRPGNYRGLNWELAGFANQTRAQWLDPFGVAMFARMAPIAAASMRRWGIPNRWCSIADLRARRPGLTTHNDLRIAFGVTTHTDPGPNFPFDYLQQVLAAALNPQEDDMPKIMLVEDGPNGRGLYAGGGSGWWNLAPDEVGPFANRWGIAVPADWEQFEHIHYGPMCQQFGPYLGTSQALAVPAGEPGPAGPPGPAVLVPHTHQVPATGPADATE